MDNITSNIYHALQSNTYYPVRLFHKSQIFASLYERNHQCDDSQSTPLDITMTCDTEKDIWIITATEAPLLPKAKIASIFKEKCAWLSSHTYTYEYKALFNCRYLVITIGLDDDICNTFVDKLKSIDIMLHELFGLPVTDS